MACPSFEGIERLTCIPFGLKGQLQGKLQHPWRSRIHHLPKRASIDVPIHRRWTIKLGMIEDVERLHAELQCLGFRQRQVFQKSHIVVVQARPGEESSRSISRRTQRLQTEQVRIEKWQPVPRILI